MIFCQCTLYLLPTVIIPLFLKRRKVLHTIGTGETSRLFLWQSCHCGSPLHPCGPNITGTVLTVGDGSPRIRPLSKLMASPVSLQTNQILDAIHYPSLLPVGNETVRFPFGGFLPLRLDFSLI